MILSSTRPANHHRIIRPAETAGQRCDRVSGRHRIGNVNSISVQQAHELRIKACRAVFAAPQLTVIIVGPAGRDRAIDQADPALHHLNGVRRGRHELLQCRLHGRHEGGHYSRYRGLRQVPHIAQEFLRAVLPKIHAGDLYRLIEAARSRPSGFLTPRLIQRTVNTEGKLLHLRDHQAYSTIVTQRFSRGLRILSQELSNYLGRIVVFYDDTPVQGGFTREIARMVVSRSCQEY